MDELKPLGDQDSVVTPPTTAAPLPVLGGMAANAPVLRQSWQGENYTVPIVLKQGRQTWKDQISEFRTGHVIIGSDGCTLTGKAVLPAHIRNPILIVCLVTIRFAYIIAYLILEYAFRRDRTENLTWNEVDAVLIDSPKNRACIIYHLAAKPKTKYALGLKLDGGYLNDFQRAVRSFIPERVIEGKIGAATPVWLWIVIVAIFGIIIAAALLSSGKP